MKKYPKVKRLGHRDNDGILDSPEIFVQEKMDGANFRFTLQTNIEEEYHTDDRELVFGSRNVVYKNEKDVDSAFTHAIEHIRENVDVDAIRRLERDHGPLVFYGEAMHSHTLDYQWDDVPSFLGFDIWSDEYRGWCHPKTMEASFKMIGLSTAPRLFFGPPEEFETTSVPDSMYRDGVAEGFMIKNAQGTVAKVRSEKFKEMHDGPSPSSPDEESPDDAAVLAHTFATESRIMKMIHKYENRGVEIEMAIMEDFWREVFDDIIEEEYDTIFLGNHTIDTQQFRSEVASRCANVLDIYLSRPDDSVLNETPA